MLMNHLQNFRILGYTLDLQGGVDEVLVEHTTWVSKGNADYKMFNVPIEVNTREIIPMGILIGMGLEDYCLTKYKVIDPSKWKVEFKKDGYKLDQLQPSALYSPKLATFDVRVNGKIGRTALVKQFRGKNLCYGMLTNKGVKTLVTLQKVMDNKYTVIEGSHQIAFTVKGIQALEDIIVNMITQH